MNQQDKSDYIAPGVVTAILIAAAIVWHNRLGGDFWPVDRSYVGPNILASGVCLSVAFFWGLRVGRRREKRLHERLDAQDVTLQAHGSALDKHELSHKWIAQALQDVADGQGTSLLSHPHEWTKPNPKVGAEVRARTKPTQN